MTIDFEKPIIGCVPIWAYPQPPDDQPGCVCEICPICNKGMWVSDLKRLTRDANDIKTYCWACIVNDQVKRGLDPSDVEFKRLDK